MCYYEIENYTIFMFCKYHAIRFNERINNIKLYTKNIYIFFFCNMGSDYVGDFANAICEPFYNHN